MNVLMETPVLFQLTVYRTPSEGGEQKSSKYNHIHCIYEFYTHYYKCSYSGYSQDPEIEIVELIKPEQGGLGLMILEDE